MRQELTPLSYSSLKEFMKSPAHFLAYKNRELKETPAMRFGTAVHSAILEPQKFINQYDKTDLRRNTKAYKELDDSKLWLSSSEWSSIEGIKRSISRNVSASDELSKCVHFEQEVKGLIKGVEFRGFVDAMSQDTIIDLKTTQDASPDGFAKSVYNFSYHLQASIYLELTGADRYFILAVENQSPYSCALYELSQDALDSGRAMLEKGIAMFKDWDGSYQGYEKHNFQKLDLPRWAK